MKFIIKHEAQGRMRIQLAQPRMSLEQADLLELYLRGLPQVTRAAVHERTRCAIVEYQGPREDIIPALSRFSYQTEGFNEQVPTHTTPEINRA